MNRAIRIFRRFWQDETGTTLVELAFVLPLFLLLFFGLIDFGRMGAEYVMADKAMQIATRIAVVRPPACPGVPATNLRGTVPPNTTPPRFGTNCSAGATVCAATSAAPCIGAAGNATVDEIWATISPLMPSNATEANLSFAYDFDPDLNFLGGPYVPVVTVEITGLNFNFVTPLGGLAALASNGAGTGPSATVAFPAMSMSLPGEDLNLGENG